MRCLIALSAAVDTSKFPACTFSVYESPLQALRQALDVDGPVFFAAMDVSRYTPCALYPYMESGFAFDPDLTLLVAAWDDKRDVKRFLAAASVVSTTRSAFVGHEAARRARVPPGELRLCAECDPYCFAKGLPYERSLDLQRRQCIVGRRRRANASNVVIVTGVNEREGHNGRADMDLALSKQVYASYHGYAFEYYDARAFFLNGLAWEFSKILMIQHALYKHPSKKWVVWIDADAWVNPKYLPLSEWLADVPREKLAVLSNFRGFNTGVVAFRTGKYGRSLLAEWFAVARAGLAKCHPHDQAALQYLQLRYINRTMDCTRCDHWSCIPLWHQVLHDTFTQVDHPDWHPKWDTADVVDRGFANDFIAPFHIVTENERRPRLQCFRCGLSLDVVEKYPGKNFPKRPQDKDGWLINHKGQSFFYKVAFKTQTTDDKAPCYVPPATVDFFKP